MPTTWIKTGSGWTQIKSLFVKTSSAWSDMSNVWIKTGSTLWSKVFTKTSVPEIANQVEITIANTSTETKRLTGRLYRWTDSTSISYRFRSSTNNISYSNITGASGTSTNPSVGSSNTNDQYVLTQSDVVANTTNYFQYVSRAVNSTFGTEAESVSFEVSFEMPRNLTLSSSKTSTSITVSWTNDTHSARYEYQTKLTSSSTWGTSVFIAPGSTTTSFTISSLSNSTSYDFRVRGRTSTTNANGYFGNWSELSVTTNAPAAPDAPTGVTTDTPDKDSFFLSWSTATTGDAATAFDFGASTSSTSAPATQVTSGTATTSGQWRTINIADRAENYELISGLSPGTDYYGWVRSRNSGGVSAWVASPKATTASLKPPKPVTNLTHVSADRTSSSLKFSWTIPTSDSTNDPATTFIHHISSTNSEPTIANYNGFIFNGTDTSVTRTGLDGSTLYYFWIRAQNDDGTSSAQTSSGTTLAVSNPPLPPTASLGSQSPSGMNLSWTAGGGGAATKYEIAFSTGTTAPTLTSVSDFINRWYDVGTATSFRAVGLAASTTYYAWVRATNADGTSANSNRPSLATRAAPTVSLPSWSSSNFQRTSYSQQTIGRAKSSATVRRVFVNNSGTNTDNPGNIPTEYSTTANTGVTIASVGTDYNGSRTVSGIGSNSNGSYIEFTGSSVSTESFTSDTDGTVTGNTRFRYGWNNGSISFSGTGTFATVEPAGFDYEIYSAATGGTLLDEGAFLYSTTTRSPQVNSTNYIYTYLSGREDLGNSANTRHTRIRTLGLDYDGKIWPSSWSNRV
jgi:hypothetical protein